jgi:hypothetical protein
MSSELWAIISAGAWAADSILVRKGTAFSNPSTAALVSFVVNTAILGPYIFFQYPLEKIFQPANLFFVVSGHHPAGDRPCVVLRRYRPARRFPCRTDPGNVAVFFGGDRLFPVPRSPRLDRVFGRDFDRGRYVAGFV